MRRLPPTTFVYLLAHASRERARESWRRFSADPESKAVRAKTEARGPLLASWKSVYLAPTDYSPIR